MSLIDLPATAAAARFGIATTGARAGALARFVERFDADGSAPSWHSDWAWNNYERLTLALAREFRLRRMLEIGGGRDPGFLQADSADLEVTINDIDPAELAFLPEGARKAAFDIAGDLAHHPDQLGAYDLVSARMVFEHIVDVASAWRNAHRLLAPGGVALAFFPTLYAWPFVINHLLPADFAKKLVERLYPARQADGDNPVFPAHYDWCFGSEKKLRRVLEPIGFSEIVVLPFWGHHYLARVPGLRELDFAFNRFSARADWRVFTTYAFVIVRK